MTMTEKILAKKSDHGFVTPGDNIWTKVDKLMTHDVCGPGTFGIFQKEFGMNAQVCWSCIILQYTIFVPDKTCGGVGAQSEQPLLQQGLFCLAESESEKT